MSSNDKAKVLVVDDEEDITMIMKLGLRKFGFIVDVFNSPTEALSHFKTNYYDAIILDIRMPSMSGFDLAKAIWAQDARARICFLSAFEIYKHEAEKVLPHFTTHCFMTKPIALSQLAKHIQAHLVPEK